MKILKLTTNKEISITNKCIHYIFETTILRTYYSYYLFLVIGLEYYFYLLFTYICINVFIKYKII